MTSIQNMSSSMEARTRQADVRSAEARLDTASREEDRAKRRREDAEGDVGRARDRAARVDSYA